MLAIMNELSRPHGNSDILIIVETLLKCITAASICLSGCYTVILTAILQEACIDKIERFVQGERSGGNPMMDRQWLATTQRDQQT